jgi:hypothetical protein
MKTRQLFLSALLIVPGVLNAQQVATVEVDHASGRVRLITRTGGGADTTDLGDDPVVRLPRSVPVEVRVANTNTAVYRFSTETKSTALPETESVQSFLATFQPYVPELRAAASNALRRNINMNARRSFADAASARSALVATMTSARNNLARIDAAVFGEEGLQENLTTSLLALEQMRNGIAPERASEPLRRSLRLGQPCQPEQPVRLPTAQRLLSALTDVVQASQELRNTIDASTMFAEQLGTLSDSARAVERQAQAAVADFEPLVANAYRVERLVGIVASACSFWVADTVSASMTSGREVTVRVEPRAEPETSRIADRPAKEFTIAIQPRAIVRPALGFIALAAPDARFANYGTREVGGGVEIYQTGTRDARFNVGGSLAFTWPGLDQRDARGFAIWLPEIVLAPGRNTTVGLGSALSWNYLKVGAGVAWIKYGALEGANVGDVVPDETALQISDAYSSPKLYFSVGVFDWAPLAGRLK